MMALFGDNELDHAADLKAMPLGQLKALHKAAEEELLSRGALKRESAMQAVVNCWNETMAPCKNVPQVKILSGVRKRHLSARLNERAFADNFPAIFDLLAHNRWARGEVVKNNGGKPWHATFDWIISSDQPYTKILEGRWERDVEDATIPAPLRRPGDELFDFLKPYEPPVDKAGKESEA